MPVPTAAWRRWPEPAKASHRKVSLLFLMVKQSNYRNAEMQTRKEPLPLLSPHHQKRWDAVQSERRSHETRRAAVAEVFRTRLLLVGVSAEMLAELMLHAGQPVPEEFRHVEGEPVARTIIA